MTTRSPRPMPGQTRTPRGATRPPAGGRTAFAVLGVLARGPLSGADITRWLDEHIGNFWRESGGQLYPTLAALEVQGDVARARSPRATGRGRPATTWAITAAGRRRLTRWLAEPATTEPRRIELLLKLFLADDAAVSAAHLARCKTEQAALLAHYAAIEAMLDGYARTDPRAAARFRATVRYGVRVAEALLAWTDEASALLGISAPSRSPSPRPARTTPRRARGA